MQPIILFLPAAGVIFTNLSLITALLKALGGSPLNLEYSTGSLGKSCIGWGACSALVCPYLVSATQAFVTVRPTKHCLALVFAVACALSSNLCVACISYYLDITSNFLSMMPFLDSVTSSCFYFFLAFISLWHYYIHFPCLHDP